MGKLTISMAIFNSKLLNYQRVCQLQTADEFWSYHVISIFSLRDFRFKMRNTHICIYVYIYIGRIGTWCCLRNETTNQPLPWSPRTFGLRSKSWLKEHLTRSVPWMQRTGCHGICKNHGLMALKWQRPCIRTSRVECARHHSEFSISGIYHRWDVSEIRWDLMRHRNIDFWYLYLSPRIYHNQSRFL